MRQADPKRLVVGSQQSQMRTSCYHGHSRLISREMHSQRHYSVTRMIRERSDINANLWDMINRKRKENVEEDRKVGS